MFSLPRRLRRAAPLILPLAALALAACDSTHSFTPDQPPTVTLTSGPVDTVSAPQSWLVDISWTGSDPDGRIDHYEYAIDPPSAKQARFALAETAWVSTHETHVVARFRASHPDSLGPGATASDFHVFVLRAIDDRRVASPRVVRAFYAYTIAPDVQFTDPLPSRLLPARVGIPFRLTWAGNDPDGGGSNQPAAYRLRLLLLTGGQNTAFVVDPDSLLRLGAQTDWAGWRTVGGDTTSLAIDEVRLIPGTQWLAALVAVDAAGATTPYLLPDRNLLVFDVLFSGGPSVHVFSPWIDYTGRPSSLEFTPPVEVPAGQPLSFNLEGIASAGRHIIGTRWALDNENINDYTPRSNEDTDLGHWSRLHDGVVAVSFPISSPGQHVLGIETFDDFGAYAVLFVRLTVVAFTFDRDLLVVDDTRLEVDKIDLTTGCPLLYTQPWPSRSEMDTLLFARGGYPWRCARNPVAALSPAGLLAGYAFDTLGTRLGLENPAAAVSLSRLSQYRHVLWITDQKSALTGALTPVTTLRAMCAPGQVNTLAEYVKAGGQVWLAGGGAAYASLINFNTRNDDACGVLFTFDAGELVPGRMMYDQAHVHSAIGASQSGAEPQRSPAARGGWSGHGPDGTLSAPDYSRLPVQLHFKTVATDPIPPTRLASQGSLFYRTTAADEFVAAPNAIVENFDRSGTGERLESALDTLYEVSSTQLCVSSAPAMLYYHGRDDPPFVFTGFDLWSWSQADCQGLVDFVLGDIWKLSRSAPVARAAARTPLPVATRRLDPRIMRP